MGRIEKERCCNFFGWMKYLREPNKDPLFLLLDFYFVIEEILSFCCFCLKVVAHYGAFGNQRCTFILFFLQTTQAYTSIDTFSHEDIPTPLFCISIQRVVMCTLSSRSWGYMYPAFTILNP
ncbi:hypothetical protein Droror1_Dr00020377 [Drosera rotundifolia]